MRGIVLECVKPSSTDEITKREYILQCLNPQMILLYVRESFLENTNCNVINGHNYTYLKKISQEAYFEYEGKSFLPWALEGQKYK